MERFRVKLGLTQEELSERSQVSRAHIASLETGRRNPSPADIFALVTALRLDGREREEFETEAMIARVKGKKDIGPFVLSIYERMNLASEKLRLAVNIASSLRDLAAQAGLKVPENFDQDLARLKDLQ